VSIIALPKLAALAVCAFCMVPWSWAQNYPTKSVRFVVPFAPGGGTDTVARLVAQKLSDAWGQPVVVDNRAGGTGAVGSAIVAQARPDGYTLLMVTSSTHAISPNLQSNLPYDPIKDFQPISLLSTGPQIMVGHPSVTASTVKELVALAKTRSFNYASTGSGGLAHMAAELFKSVTGVNMVHVPYKGAGAAVTDLLGGHVQLMFSGPISVVQHTRSRKLKAFAVTSPARLERIEDIPTFVESGYPTVVAMQWYGVVTTAGVPNTVVTTLNREIVRIMQLPDVKERFLVGEQAVYSTPQAFADLIRNDLAKWRKVVQSAGIRLE
jgi:tripartite-type tricarboxylate transporter receptor subunit TctC